jgi:hypothetical protein
VAALAVTAATATPTLVYHALPFYHAHSELRSELATPQALKRIGTR